jgi:hypothetical protein
MINNNNDNIKNLIVSFNNLQSDYQKEILIYNQKKENYFQELQKVHVNPCSSYSLLGTSTNISLDCYKQIWSDQKCTKPVTSMDAAQSSKTFIQLLAEVFNISKSADKIPCYNTATPSNPNTASSYVARGRETNFVKIPPSGTRAYSWVVDGSSSTNSPVLSTDADNCLQHCAKTMGCTGATYNIGTQSPFTKTCNLVIGNGKLVETTVPESPAPQQIAIYLKLSNYLNELNESNSRLLAIISRLDTLRGEIQSYQITIKNDLDNIEGPFTLDYEELLIEKKKLTDMIHSYHNIEASYKENYKLANDSKLGLRFWSIIAVIMVLFIIKYFLGFDSPSINVGFFIIIFIVLGLSLSTPSGFAAMCIFFLVFLILVINKIF